MLYQATRQLADFDNGIEIPYGAYVETACSLWVARIGTVILRPLAPGELPKPNAKIIKVLNTVEDVKKVVIEEPEVEEVVEEPEVEEVVVASRRKIRPKLSSGAE